MANFSGSVNVTGDVVGYYTRESLEEVVGRFAAAESRITALEKADASLEAAQPFVVTNHESDDFDLVLTPKAYVSVSVTARPIPTETMKFPAEGNHIDARCSPSRRHSSARIAHLT